MAVSRFTDHDPEVVFPWPALAAAGAAFGLAAATSTSDDGLVLCPLRRCSGGYCPGCGLSRASAQLVRGDLAGSWHQHPFLLVGLAQMAVLGAVWALVSPATRDRLRPHTTTLVMANVALLVAIWGARMASGSIPVPFLAS